MKNTIQITSRLRQTCLVISPFSKTKNFFPTLCSTILIQTVSFVSLANYSIEVRQANILVTKWKNLSWNKASIISRVGSSRPEVFLRKGVLKICSKFTGEDPCRSVISIKLLCNFIEIALLYECSPVNLLHISKTPYLKNTPGRLFLWE